jgi:hypothetical protein
MPVARDGSKHHSMGRAKLHDEIHGKGGSKFQDGGGGAKVAEEPAKGAASEHEEPDQDEGGKGMEAMPDTETPIEEHVSEHGPAEAHQHVVGKDGMHHVLTHHGGSKHKSRHNSPEEAHAHIGKAMGMEAAAEPMGPEAPEAAGAPAGGGGIPGLA